jgi:hypothetical protein
MFSRVIYGDFSAFTRHENFEPLMLEKRHVYNPKKTQNFLIVVHDKSEKEID